MASTIFALSSGQLPSAIAIFRLSGPQSLSVLKKISRRQVWKPKMLEFTRIYDLDKELIDEAMGVYLPGPRTFTGEDTAEIFIHGSIAIAGKMAETLSKLENVREAKRGEFSRRAFYNGKMDLAQVQGLNNLIRSRSEKERKIAFGQMRGGEKALEIRDQLKHVISQLYVIMDFGEHVEMGIEEARENVLKILEMCRKLRKAWKMAERTQRGLNIVLYGKPNCGKSSILNKLVHSDVAIVSPIAGTTRDSIDKVIAISGVRCRITDTAGIRDETTTNDIIELEGIRRAKKRISSADIILLIIDPDTSCQEFNQMLDDIKRTSNPESNIVIIKNKSDLNLQYPTTSTAINSNTVTENGLTHLRNKLNDLVDEMCPEASFLVDAVILEKCEHHLELAAISSDAAIMCANIESAQQQIAELTSNLVSEDVLDHIFDKFCIGK